MGLWHGALALVHKVHYALDLPAEDVLEDDDRVFARVLQENLFKVRAAKGRKKTNLKPVSPTPLKKVRSEK